MKLIRAWRARRWRHGRDRLVFVTAAAWLAGLSVLHIAAMCVIEHMSLPDAVWVTAVTVTTVGYGDVVPHTVGGRAATIFILFFCGIPALAKMATGWFEWRDAVRSLKNRGKWKWKMTDHVLIIGTPSGDANRFFKAVVRQIRAAPAWSDAPIHLLTKAFDSRPEGLPDGLKSMAVVHTSGSPTDPDALEAADAGRARAVIILADREDDPLWDSVSLDAAGRVLAMARAEGRRAPPIVVECVEDRNRALMLAAGATSAVRPLRTYPEMLVRAVTAPGSEHLLEGLFRSEGDDLHRVDLGRTWHGNWAEIACPLIERGIGTAIAAIAPDGSITVNPRVGKAIDVAALFVVVRDMRPTLCAEISDVTGTPARLSE